GRNGRGGLKRLVLGHNVLRRTLSSAAKPQRMTSPEVLGAAAEPTAHVPVHLTRFVGRGRELEDLAQILLSARLLTLTGAGGSGKTPLRGEHGPRFGAQ